tara:strand:- start:642 stop:1301 length:660 start_codon:yes stop_codon:yes gene_type:complete
MTKPNYYAVIPAEVRYSKNLTPNAKLLYAEITALSQKDGSCWASNKYFSKLYDVSTVTISRWVSSLVENNFINREIVYKKGTKEIDKRYLQLCNGGINKNVNAPINKNVKDNNTSINNTSINISNRRKDFVLNVMSFDYDKNILNSFVDYWTEPNKSKTKMKFELQQTWSTNLRLKTWIKNQKKWDKPKKQTMSKIHQHLQKNINVKAKLLKQLKNETN